TSVNVESNTWMYFLGGSKQNSHQNYITRQTSTFESWIGNKSTSE
uniref:Uncharacterized protein n=1 Tax=Caenorhabditis japonica TaxID=281687 RepID=A0A8R1IC78_CAEJA